MPDFPGPKSRPGFRHCLSVDFIGLQRERIPDATIGGSARDSNQVWKSLIVRNGLVHGFGHLLPALASPSLSQREMPLPERSRRERRLAEAMDEAMRNDAWVESRMEGELQAGYDSENP